MGAFPVATYRITTANIATPAAGAQAAQVVPDGQIWELESVRIVLTTDATVANRTVNVAIYNSAGTATLWTGSDILHTASQGATYYFAPSARQSASFAIGGFAVSPLPYPITLTSGDEIRTRTINMQAGDQLSSITIRYRVKFKN